MTRLRVGINGFGRIGRLVMRLGIQHPDIEFVGVNDLATTENLAYLFKYDSTHGMFAGEVEAAADRLIINGMSVDCQSIRNPAELPWKALQVDYEPIRKPQLPVYQYMHRLNESMLSNFLVSFPTG